MIVNEQGQLCKSGNDVCLLKFDSSIFESDTSNSVEAACLPQAESTHGRACWIAGWGATSVWDPNQDDQPPSGTRILQEAGVNLFDVYYCYDNTVVRPTGNGEICAGIPDQDGNGISDGGVDACKGDSGGPLLCDVAGVTTLTGVVSKGKGCAREGDASIYADVFYFKSWIEQTIAEN